MKSFEYNLRSKPILVKIKHFHYQPHFTGLLEECPSTVDYFGGYTIDYDVCSLDGVLLNWSLDTDETCEIEGMAIQLLKEQDE